MLATFRKQRSRITSLALLPQARSVQLPGVDDFSSLEAERQRFLQSGYTSSAAVTLKEIRKTRLDDRELER